MDEKTNINDEIEEMINVPEGELKDEDVTEVGGGYLPYVAKDPAGLAKIGRLPIQ